jgi:menaquinone-9 beta-reductase
MIEHRKYDVLIAGARCAGAATAMLLARSGLRVLVIDRGAHGTDTLSTHALMRGGVMQLHRWGVLPRVIAAGTPPIRRTTFHYGQFATEILVKSAHGIDSLYAPRRTVLDRALVDAASAAGAEVCYGHELVDLVRDRTGRVRGAIIREPGGLSTAVGAELVIGADGAGSTAARLVEAPVTRIGEHASTIVYGHFSRIPDTGYRWYYDPGLSAGVIPTNGGRHCVFVAMSRGQHRDRLRSDVAAGFQWLLTKVAPDVAAHIARSLPDSGFWTFPGRKGFLRKPYGAGWALVGDAGYFRDPITAHGITDALRDAELLALAVARGSEAALADYEAVRDDLSKALFDETDTIACFAWDLDGVRASHVALNQAMQREVAYLAALPDITPRGCNENAQLMEMAI